MTGLRKFIGLLILILMGIPILFSIIWAVGMTKAALSPQLVSDLPREIIDEVPTFVDDVIKTAHREDIMMDENSRAWLNALVEADISIADLMRDTGLLDWLQNELSVSLETVGDILRGERKPETVVLDLRPLKRALQHDAIDKYLIKVLSKLPPCSESQMAVWEHAAFGAYESEDLPACRPDEAVINTALKAAKTEMTWDVPDSIDILEGAHYLPRGMDIGQTVASMSIFLFLIPALLILGGSLVAATSKSSFFRWSGVSTLIGGLSALGLAYFAQKIVPWAIQAASYNCTETFTRMEELVIEKIGGLAIVASDYLFAPVVSVAGIVCVVGVVLFALSFAFAPEQPLASRPQQQQRQPESTTPTPGAVKTADTAELDKPEKTEDEEQR